MKLEEQIESLVQQKKTSKARALIALFIRQQRAHKNVLFKASQWYRRLSLYKEGLRLVMQLGPFEPLATNDIKIRTAEFLSILGSNAYAVQLLSETTFQTTDDYEVAAGIYFAANDYAKALELFQKRLGLMPEADSYQGRLSQLSCADCLVQLDRIKEAILIAQNLLKKSREPLFLAICQQALGEYLARSGQPRKGLVWIQKSAQSFPGKKETYDHALLYRWLGYTSAQLGKKSEGRRHFAHSTKIIKKIGLREEIWLDNLRFEGELDLLTKKDEHRLQYFPGIPPVHKAQKLPLTLGPSNGLIKINLSSEEYAFKNEYFLGLPLEIKLLAYLRIAEAWGIGFELLKVLLWPREPNSYLQLEARLIQLLHRLKKKYQIVVLVKSKRAYLNKKDNKKIQIHIEDRSLLPSRMKKVFTAEEFREAYNLKKTQSLFWINHYLTQGKIQKIQKGPKTWYEIIERDEPA